MTKFAKEQLSAKAREQIAFCRNTKITGEGRAHVNQCSALFEIALAALMAPTEPVYQYRIRNAYNGQVTEWQTIRRDQVDFVLKAQPLNAEFQIIAPPVPVVPEEATPGSIEILASIRPPHGVAYQWDEDQRHAAADAWNACRGAMLQGADGNSAVIPDGYALVPVEPTEDMVIHGFESVPHPLFQPADWDKYQTMSGCEQAAHRAKLCWAAMIAAAPQQEAE